MRSSIAILALALLSSFAPAQPKENLMQHHAHGSFTVKVMPLTPAPAEGLARYSLDKKFHGDLEGAGKGEMIGGGDLKSGVAGYVAMETITGTLAGRRGSFALQHSATMDHGVQKMTIIVVPGSGAGGLQGISGTFAIRIADGQHFYDFDYMLPE